MPLGNNNVLLTFYNVERNAAGQKVPNNKCSKKLAEFFMEFFLLPSPLSLFSLNELTRPKADCVTLVEKKLGSGPSMESAL